MVKHQGGDVNGGYPNPEAARNFSSRGAHAAADIQHLLAGLEAGSRD
jgi:hypothetical protein